MSVVVRDRRWRELLEDGRRLITISFATDVLAILLPLVSQRYGLLPSALASLFSLGFGLAGLIRVLGAFDYAAVARVVLVLSLFVPLVSVITRVVLFVKAGRALS